MKKEDLNINWMDQCTGLLFCHIVESESKVNLTINRLVALCPTSSTVAVASLVVVETATDEASDAPENETASADVTEEQE